MNTAKKTLYVALGAGTTVLEKARELPQAVITLPGVLTERVNDFRKSDRTIALNPATLRDLPKNLPARASALVDEAKKFTGKATERFLTTYADLSVRGESVAKKVQNSAPTKRAVDQTNAAKSKVKAAATSVKKAANADVDAVKAAAAQVG